MIKRCTGALLLIGFALCFAACEGMVEKKVLYTFDNKSSQTITVMMHSAFFTKDSGDTYTESISKNLTLYSNTKKDIYTASSDLDFEWTAYNESDNKKISCTVDGGKATFRNR